MTAARGPLRPAVFSRQLLRAIDSAEGRTRRRKRDQTPDRLGLDLKREILQRSIDEDPEPEDFEGWLLTQALTAPASGPIRAMCVAIMDEYRLARTDPAFERWLEEGAPSDDAQSTRPRDDATVDPRLRALGPE